MGLVYLFALALSLGLLLLQVVLGAAQGGAGGDHELDAGGDHELDAGGDHELDADADHELDADADHELDAGHGHAHHAGPADGASALFLSTRFWIFFALAFGMSGSLIHFLGLAGMVATLVIAVGAGLCGGLFAALAFRAVRRDVLGAASATSEAVGATGKVLVACAKGRVGQIRIELKGRSVDLLATTDDDDIARGEPVLVEDVRGSVAHVCRRPAELE